MTSTPVTLQARRSHLLGGEPVHVVGHPVGGVIATDAFWSAKLAIKPALEVEAADPGLDDVTRGAAAVRSLT